MKSSRNKFRAWILVCVACSISPLVASLWQPCSTSPGGECCGMCLPVPTFLENVAQANSDAEDATEEAGHIEGGQDRSRKPDCRKPTVCCREAHAQPHEPGMACSNCQGAKTFRHDLGLCRFAGDARDHLIRGWEICSSCAWRAMSWIAM
jgi:hypothetical protein